MFPLLNAGLYTLGLHCAGYDNKFQSVELFPNKVSSYIVSMSKAYNNRMLKNTPYTFTGSGVNGSGRTTHRGAYSIRLSAGDHTLTINSSYGTAIVTVTIPAGGIVTKNLLFSR